MKYINYKASITATAKRDYYEAEYYMAQKLYSHIGVVNLAKSFREAIKDLKFFPTKYPLCNDDLLRAWGIRFVPVKNYLLFYVVREDEQAVYVIRFLYGKRDWQNILRKQIESGEAEYAPYLTNTYVQEAAEKYGE